MNIIPFVIVVLMPVSHPAIPVDFPDVFEQEYYFEDEFCYCCMEGYIVNG
jgi:hypothetical protein